MPVKQVTTRRCREQPSGRPVELIAEESPDVTRVTFWGTRGSLASPGLSTARYGGNTACVESRSMDGTLLLLDAGTGIRSLGATVGPETTRVDILLTQLHMDHIQGFGFFRPLYRRGLDVHIWGPSSEAMSLSECLTRYLSPPLFPVRLSDLPCGLTLHEITRDMFEIGGVRVTASAVCHPGTTLGYRICDNGTSLAYIPDHEPALLQRDFERFAGPTTSGFDLVAGVDMLIHDAQYSDAEYAEHIGWGHSAIAHTLALAAAAGVKRLVPFHYDPAHDDAFLDSLFEAARRSSSLPFDLIPASEGATVSLRLIARGPG